jgi:aminopeptidase N
VLSLLRGFSAPVKLDMPRSEQELAFLFAHDPEPFNRWDAGQTLAIKLLLASVADAASGRPLRLDSVISDAFRATMTDPRLEPALIAQALTLPSESYLADQCETVDVEAIHSAREFMRTTLAERLGDELRDCYARLRSDEPYRFDAASMARRSLKNLCLSYLLETGSAEARRLCTDQLDSANNMTDTLAALAALSQHDWPERDDWLERFYQRWQHDPQVVEKWFSIQAGSRLPDTLQRVVALLDHPAFSITNPNKVRALIGRFCHGNPVRFHAANGAGYAFLADRVLELDAINPQVAARLVSTISRWKRYDNHRQQLMQHQLQRIMDAPKLSRDVYEIVAKSLG